MSTLRWLPTTEAEAEGLTARPFGTRTGDLEIDFTAPPEAALTALLAACLSDPAGAPFAVAEIARWSVKQRRQGLIAAAVATSGPERALTARCADHDCGTVMELVVDLTHFRADWRAERITLVLGDKVVHLRPPRPEDLAAWAEAGPAGLEAFAARLVLETSAPAPGGWGDAAEAALAEDDRLAGLVLDTACPECGRSAQVPLILESFLMRDLAARAAAAMDEVHELASAYHWSEAEILALPPSRRHHYLARIAEAWS